MKTLILSTLIISLSTFGCIPTEVEMNRRDYIIENNTNFKVDIRFYDRFNGRFNSQTSTILNNKGDQLSEKVEQTSEFDNSGYNLFSAFQADSAKIIINGNKYYTNTFNTFDGSFSVPINRNLFRHSNYENLGNEQYLFKITQQDYDNAQDCNGNCD